MCAAIDRALETVARRPLLNGAEVIDLLLDLRNRLAPLGALDAKAG